MKDLAERLEGSGLSSSMEISFKRSLGSTYAFMGVYPVDFDYDECPGTALFIVRGLKAIEDVCLSWSFDDKADPESRNMYRLYAALPGKEVRRITGEGEHMAQAVAEALIATFGPSEVQKQ